MKDILNNKYYNIFVIILFFMPLLLLIGIIFRGQRDISVIENRNLTKFPKLSFKNFKNNIFQDNLENAIADQLVLSQTIKKDKIKTTNFVNNKLTSVINHFSSCNYYIKINGNYYHYKCSDYIIEKPVLDNADYKKFIKIYNNINFDEKYIYFIEKDRTIDFNNISEKENVYEFIKNNFKAKKYGRFKLDSYSDLEKYFYQTDHHWNYLGQYKGYKEIINLLLGDKEKLIEPKSIKTYDVIFNGSASRISITNTSKEKFTVYKYDIPTYKTYINDKKATYGHIEEYDNNMFDKDVYANHYGLYYGADYAKIEYDFNNKNKDNLLIIATSYSNSINDLIASHFYKTFVVDLRHYENTYKEELDINRFIKDNNIDKVLIMGDIYSFAEVR